MKQIVQYLPTSADRWVRSEARLIGGALAGWGWSVLTLAGGTPEVDTALAELRRTQSLTVIHLTRDAADAALLQVESPEIVFLHSAVDETMLDLCEEPERGRFRQAGAVARHLVPRAALCIAHCAAGARLLEELGAHRVRTIAPLVDEEFINLTPDRYAQAFVRDGHRCLLTCGDILPGSGSTDALRSGWYFDTFENRTGQSWRLLLAGRNDRCDGATLAFGDALAAHRIPSEKLCLDGALTDSELRAWFAAAEVYLHFDAGDLHGGAVLAAMRLGIPVVGAAVGAALDLLGDAAPLADRVIHSAIAEHIAFATDDPEWRGKILAAQAARLDVLRSEATLFVLRSLLSRFE